jgi:ABC-2 type transport system ATP-binding protein
LLQMPTVQEATVRGDEVEIRIDGGDEIRSAILSLLIGKGFRVVDFHQRQMDLEDVFMTVTKGEVQ